MSRKNSSQYFKVLSFDYPCDQQIKTYPVEKQRLFTFLNPKFYEKHLNVFLNPLKNRKTFPKTNRKQVLVIDSNLLFLIFTLRHSTNCDFLGQIHFFGGPENPLYLFHPLKNSSSFATDATKQLPYPLQFLTFS